MQTALHETRANVASAQHLELVGVERTEALGGRLVVALYQFAGDRACYRLQVHCKQGLTFEQTNSTFTINVTKNVQP